MKKYNSYRGAIFTVTTAIVFYIWSELQPWLVSMIGVHRVIVPIILGGAISLGLYKMVLTAAETIVLKCKWAKKWVFGSSYLDGTWVGSYRGLNGEPRYYIEKFEQDFDSLIIRSECYKEDLSFKGTWISTDVSINVDKGQLAYTYETNMKENTHENIGFSTFEFERDRKDKPPKRLYGFSSDLHVGKKIASVEVKVEDSEKYSKEELLEKAVEVYKEHENKNLKYEPNESQK